MLKVCTGIVRENNGNFDMSESSVDVANSLLQVPVKPAIAVTTCTALERSGQTMAFIL